MKTKTTSSVLAVIQAIALLQLAIGFLVIPAHWKSGQSDVEAVVRLGGDEAVHSYRRYTSKNLTLTSWWMAGTGSSLFVVAAAASLIGCKKGVLSWLMR